MTIAYSKNFRRKKMTIATWQAGLDFSGKGGPMGMRKVVEFYKAWNGEGDFGKWSVDQVETPYFLRDDLSREL